MGTGWSTIDNTYFGSGGLTTSYITARNANTDVTHGHLYQLWDAGKIQGCKCDLGYDGPDCSHRVSPHGDDPLTTVKSSMMKQVVQVGHTDNSAFSTDARTRFYDGVQHLGGYSETTDGAFKNSKMTTNFCETTYQLATATNKMDFTIEFADKPGQTGVQYLM